MIQQGIQADRRQEFELALSCYDRGVVALRAGLKYVDGELNKVLTNKADEVEDRANKIRDLLASRKRRVPVKPGPSRPGDEKADQEGGKKDASPPSHDDENSDDAALKSAIASAILTTKPNIKWDDVAGLEAAKTALHEAVILPMRFPQLFQGKRKPWNGILLYGVPGTGKSYLAQAVATECDATFFSISSADLVSKYQGESERLVRALFEMARKECAKGGRAVVFIDEVDSLCTSRGGNDESESSKRIKTEFLVQMQGVGNDNNGVLLLGATNYPEAIDSAIRRRFEKRIEIVLPNAEAREQILKLTIGSTLNTLKDEDYKWLAENTDGLSGSDLAILCREALMEPIRELQNAKYFTRTSAGKYVACDEGTDGAERKSLMDLTGDDLEVPAVTMEHMKRARAAVKPSVGQNDIDRINEFTRKYGSA